MPRAERSDRPSHSDDSRPSLPEGTEHVVVLEQPNRTAPEYRVPAQRLAEYDDVEISEYVDEDENPESVTVLFEPGDELPLPVARDGSYRSFSEMFACFDSDGNRLDSDAAETNAGVRKWRSGGN